MLVVLKDELKMKVWDLRSVSEDDRIIKITI